MPPIGRHRRSGLRPASPAGAAACRQLGPPRRGRWLGAVAEAPARTLGTLLGSNGAGKTTTLNAIAGLVPTTKGSIALASERIDGRPAYAIVRKGLALSPEGWRLFLRQSVERNLRLGATPVADRLRQAALLERVYALFPRLAERRH
jgi:branched-chain amino acid transport system ATP-binding protein